MTFLLTLISGVLVAAWHRGVFFGTLFSMVHVLPLAFFGQWFAGSGNSEHLLSGNYDHI